jgi:hypothetical protein
LNVDVHYQGLALAKGVPARDEDGALFVELEMPMPVGTRLDVITPDGTRAGRVFSVVEGPGAGMVVTFGVWQPKVKAPEPNAPMAEMKSAPPLQVTPPSETPAAAAAAKPAEKEDGDDEPEPSDDGKKRRERRKTRKTVIGH